MGKNSVNWVQVKDRSSVLNAARNLKMARSTQAYVRGSTVKFYEWLDSSPPSTLPEGPAIWICGDCHVGNLGPVADTKGDVAIEIRDLDQTVIGNPAHDLIRLGLSLAMSARDSDLPGVTTVKMLEQLMQGYEQAFTKAGNLMTKMEKPAAVKIAMKQALRRSWKQLVKARIGGLRPTIPLGKRFWPLTKAEHAAISGLFEGEGVDELKAAFRPNGSAAPIKVIDAAYWMKGCSSLGLLRYAVLIAFEEKAADGNDLYLVDIKEAAKTAAPHYTGAKMPRDNAMRVVHGARQLAPYLGKRMVATRMLDRPVFLRELLPQDLKLEIEQLTCNDAMIAARFLGMVVGTAHARQMDALVRKNWHRELLHHHTKTLDAPSWLWSSVVELVVSHERAYLEHCRRFAVEK
jgi:uncharacterized protein (DUF2252 family)